MTFPAVNLYTFAFFLKKNNFFFLFVKINDDDMIVEMTSFRFISFEWTIFFISFVFSCVCLHGRSETVKGNVQFCCIYGGLHFLNDLGEFNLFDYGIKEDTVLRRIRIFGIFNRQTRIFGIFDRRIVIFNLFNIAANSINVMCNGEL